jgi:single-strand DNA-binding protein
MFETTVTLVGRLITPLKQIWFSDGTLKVTGRIACTERRYDRTAGEWVDGHTLYATVVCRRGLAENAFASLRAGDPIVAHGKLYTREYEKEGVPGAVTELEAWSLGPDLHRCTAVLTKKARATAALVAPRAAADERGDADRVPSDDPWSVPAPTEAQVDPAGVPSEDPWHVPVAAATGTGEAAVGA